MQSWFWATAIPLMLIGAFEALWGLSQQVSGAKAIQGTYYSKDHFAGLLEMILPFVLMYGIALLTRGSTGTHITTSIVKAAPSLALAIAIFVAITAAMSKMGFIAMLGSLLIMGLLGLGRVSSGRKRWTLAAGLGLLAVITFVMAPSFELIRNFGGAASDATAEDRVPMAKDALRVIAAYPVFGTGLGTYYPAVLRYQRHLLNFAVISPHNDYLQLLAELGVVGFLIPATLMVSVMVCAVRAALSTTNGEGRYLGLACTGGMTAILIHSFADFNMYVPANAMVLAWIAGIAASLPGIGRKEEPGKSEGARWLPWFVRGLGGLSVLYAGAWLIFLHAFQGDARAERMFCRFGVCDSNLAYAAVVQKYGGDVASVPPGELLEFIRRDPAGPDHWEDLGDSLQKAGRTEEARRCFRWALELGPRIPFMLIRAARFHLGLGERETGLDMMRRALEGNPGFDGMVFADYDARKIPAGEIVRLGLPADAHVWIDYFRHQLEQKQVENAATVWREMVARRYGDDKAAGEYIEFLIRNGDAGGAAEAWGLYARGRDAAYPGANAVFNGDFELEPAGVRFDWRIEATAGAAIGFDREVRHGGGRSLRIEFDGKRNAGEIGVRQSVFLKPGRYVFQAYVKAREISTDQGVGFRIATEPATRLNVTTERVLGSTDWKLVEAAFQAPAGAGLIDVRLVRTPSLRFDDLIRGTLWVDQVEIRPEVRGSAAYRAGAAPR